MSIESSNNHIDHAAESLDHTIGITQRGVAAVRDRTQQLMDRAQHASDTTFTYIRGEPVKAMLIAAVAGAALLALMGLLTRSHDRV